MSRFGWGDPIESNSRVNLKGKQGVLSAGAAGVFISQGAGMPEVLQTWLKAEAWGLGRRCGRGELGQ